MKNLYVDVRAQRGLQVKEVRDSPVHINKGDVKDVLDFGQICLLFCFVSFFFFLRRIPQIQLSKLVVHATSQHLIRREPD